MRHIVSNYALLQQMLQGDYPHVACLEFPRRVDRSGYARVQIGERKYAAHRLAYEIGVGQIPAGMDICHRCDNPRCVNPHHLFAGTALDNVRDCIQKGRFPDTAKNLRPISLPGESNPSAKLSWDAVRQIRAMYASGKSQQSIAAQFGVTQTAVSCIVTHRTWKEAA